jgi:hypothetical protein
LAPVPEFNACSDLQEIEFKWGQHKGGYIYMTFNILGITLHVTDMHMTFGAEGITK